MLVQELHVHSLIIKQRINVSVVAEQEKIKVFLLTIN